MDLIFALLWSIISIDSVRNIELLLDEEEEVYFLEIISTMISVFTCVYCWFNVYKCLH